MCHDCYTQTNFFTFTAFGKAFFILGLLWDTLSTSSNIVCFCFSQLFKFSFFDITVKRVLSGHSKRTPKIGFQDLLSLNAGQKYCRNAGQKYCRMLPLEHSAILLTFIKVPLAIKIFVLSIFEWPFKTGFTVPKEMHMLWV